MSQLRDVVGEKDPADGCSAPSCLYTYMEHPSFAKAEEERRIEKSHLLVCDWVCKAASVIPAQSPLARVGDKDSKWTKCWALLPLPQFLSDLDDILYILDM